MLDVYELMNLEDELKRATNTEICPNQIIYHLFVQFQSSHYVQSVPRKFVRLLIC